MHTRDAEHIAQILAERRGPFARLWRASSARVEG